MYVLLTCLSLLLLLPRISRMLMMYHFLALIRRLSYGVSPILSRFIFLCFVMTKKKRRKQSW